MNEEEEFLRKGEEKKLPKELSASTAAKFQLASVVDLYGTSRSNHALASRSWDKLKKSEDPYYAAIIKQLEVVFEDEKERNKEETKIKKYWEQIRRNNSKFGGIKKVAEMLASGQKVNIFRAPQEINKEGWSGRVGQVAGEEAEDDKEDQGDEANQNRPSLNAKPAAKPAAKPTSRAQPQRQEAAPTFNANTNTNTDASTSAESTDETSSLQGDEASLEDKFKKADEKAALLQRLQAEADEKAALLQRQQAVAEAEKERIKQEIRRQKAEDDKKKERIKEEKRLQAEAEAEASTEANAANGSDGEAVPSDPESTVANTDANASTNINTNTTAIGATSITGNMNYDGTTSGTGVDTTTSSSLDYIDILVLGLGGNLPPEDVVSLVFPYMDMRDIFVIVLTSLRWKNCLSDVEKELWYNQLRRHRNVLSYCSDCVVAALDTDEKEESENDEECEGGKESGGDDDGNDEELDYRRCFLRAYLRLDRSKSLLKFSIEFCRLGYGPGYEYPRSTPRTFEGTDCFRSNVDGAGILLGGVDRASLCPGPNLVKGVVIITASSIEGGNKKCIFRGIYTSPSPDAIDFKPYRWKLGEKMQLYTYAEVRKNSVGVDFFLRFGMKYGEEEFHRLTELELLRLLERAFRARPRTIQSSMLLNPPPAANDTNAFQLHPPVPLPEPDSSGL